MGRRRRRRTSARGTRGVERCYTAGVIHSVTNFLVRLENHGFAHAETTPNLWLGRTQFFGSGEPNYLVRILVRVLILIHDRPEVYVAMAGLAHMHRTFTTDVLYPVIPGKVEISTKEGTLAQRLYASYLDRKSSVGNILVITESFLDYARIWAWDTAKNTRRTRAHTTSKTTTAIGVRFAFETTDNSLGQFAGTLDAHAIRSCLRMFRRGSTFL